MRITSIDIGTNTMLMLIGDINEPSNKINTILDIQQIPRLGKGVDENRNISDESVEKAIEILKEYKQISKEHGSENIKATATSFLRDAINKHEFIEKVKNETGIAIEILSGDDEARWTFLGGAFEQLQTPKDDLQVCTIDIGGGSTEIVTAKNFPVKLNREEVLNHPVKGKSVNIG